MKSLYVFKIVDVIGQILCLVVPIVLSTYYGNTNIVFAAYFSVGGWQLLSYFISWVAMEGYLKSNFRKVYSIILLIIAISAILLLFKIPATFLFLYVYLFFTPFMAMMYFVITINEMILLGRLVNRDEFIEKR